MVANVPETKSEWHCNNFWWHVRKSAAEIIQCERRYQIRDDLKKEETIVECGCVHFANTVAVIFYRFNRTSVKLTCNTRMRNLLNVKSPV
jgi:hypothetical protein